MAGGDADAIRASYAALNRGDIEGTLAPLDERAVWEEHSELPEAGTYDGLDAIRSLLSSFLESWQDLEQEVDDVSVRDARVLVFLHMRARGRGSGVEVESRYAHLWTMDGGRAVRVDAYYDRDRALRALGATGED